MNLIRIILSIICTLASAGLAVRVVVEHEARVTLDQQDGALRERLSQMDQVIAENQRLSNLVAQARGSPSRPNERAKAPLERTSGRRRVRTDKRAEVPWNGQAGRGAVWNGQAVEGISPLARRSGGASSAKQGDRNVARGYTPGPRCAAQWPSRRKAPARRPR